MSVKIQINSLEALERLIGGDSSIELDIRNSIVQEFTRKHLKALANEEVVKNTGKAISEEIMNEFFTKSGTNSWNTYYVLNEKGKDVLKSTVEREFSNMIRDIVKENLNIDKTRAEIDELLKKQSFYISAELTNSNLEDRLNSMVNTKLKEKLGIK